jgi:hypothetical protein
MIKKIADCLRNVTKNIRYSHFLLTNLATLQNCHKSETSHLALAGSQPAVKPLRNIAASRIHWGFAAGATTLLVAHDPFRKSVMIFGLYANFALGFA